MNDATPRVDAAAELANLDEVIGVIWAEILAHPLAKTFANTMMSADRRIYALYMTQVYHYTFHTARNQALVGANLHNVDLRYMRYCFEHALEETGHEQMALHDLRAVGLRIEDPARDVPRPLPATELLIAYLYWVSTQGNPTQRLGYSYWAERSYDFIRPMIDTVRGRMNLATSDMTFFFAHSNVDEKHARDVTRVLAEVCRTADDWAAVRRTAEMTLRLTLQILEQVYGEYVKLRDGLPSEYACLNVATPPST